VNTDRTAGAWIALQNLQDPMGLYARMYRAKVVAQSDDADTVDVRPDDPSLPDMANIPLRHGVPGLRVSVAMGSYVLVGWDDGRPDHPFAALWTAGVEALKISIPAARLNLGDQAAFEAFVLGTSYRTAEDAMLETLQIAFQTMADTCRTNGALSPLFTSMKQASDAISDFQKASGAALRFLSLGVFGS
jgi:hypothetical protein